MKLVEFEKKPDENQTACAELLSHLPEGATAAFVVLIHPEGVYNAVYCGDEGFALVGTVQVLQDELCRGLAE